MTKPLTPQQRAAATRVAQDKPRAPQRSAHWHTKARELARLNDLNVAGVLDMHDHLADLLEWEGVPRAEAEWFAWQQTVEILVPKRAA